MNRLCDLNGKTAVITGGLGGLGTASALTLARCGADILLLDIVPTDAPDVVSHIEAMGRKAVYRRCDVTDPDQVSAVADYVRSVFGRVDVLFNNAASAELVPAEDMEDWQWEKTVSVSLTGTFLCCRALGTVMVEQRAGSIINMASIAGIVGLPRGTAHHSAAKGGVISFTRSLAVEWAEYGIRVNVLAPGQINTRPLQDLMANPEVEQQILRAIPMKRVGEPEEIAAAVAFLASDDCRFMNGHTLVIDGGATIV